MTLKIGVIGAMEEEVARLRDALSGSKAVTGLGQTFYQGKLAGNNVALGTSGIGKVRAAATAQFMIDRFHIDSLVFAGVAGGLSPEIRPGDVVIARRTREHDFSLTEVTDPQRQGKGWFDTDPYLAGLALSLGRHLGLPARAGTVISGDQAITTSERKQWLWQTFAADCVEMEGAAVAQVCALNRVPFLLVRGISDMADHNVYDDFRQHFRRAAANAADIALAVVRALADGQEHDEPMRKAPKQSRIVG